MSGFIYPRSDYCGYCVVSARVKYDGVGVLPGFSEGYDIFINGAILLLMYNTDFRDLK